MPPIASPVAGSRLIVTSSGNGGASRLIRGARDGALPVRAQLLNACTAARITYFCGPLLIGGPTHASSADGRSSVSDLARSGLNTSS